MKLEHGEDPCCSRNAPLSQQLFQIGGILKKKKNKGGKKVMTVQFNDRKVHYGFSCNARKWCLQFLQITRKFDFFFFDNVSFVSFYTATDVYQVSDLSWKHTWIHDFIIVVSDTLYVWYYMENHIMSSFGLPSTRETLSTDNTWRDSVKKRETSSFHWCPVIE